MLAALSREREPQFLGQRMLAEYQIITTTPPSKQSNPLSGRTEGLMGHEFQRKMLQYFKNQVTGNVLQSFQHCKCDSPEIPTRMILGGNVIQPFALHIKKTLGRGGGKKKLTHP